MSSAVLRHLALSTRFSAKDVRCWDVLVVGAGPAGATAAFHLASRGHAVLLLDKSTFPREKVCGDALIPDALSSLRRLGLYDLVSRTGFRVDRISIHSPSGIRVEVPAECVTLKRDILDTLIVEAAVKQGAVFRVGAVTSIRQPSNAVVTAAIRDSDVELRARVAVVATGADVTLLEQLGMVRRRKPSAIAVRCYVRSEAEMNELVISFDRAIAPGYAWIFPLGDREYNVGCGVFFGRKGQPGVNLRQAFTRFVTETAVARPVMQARSIATPIKGARLRAGLDGAVFDGPERIVPIGETIGTTYPFTGEGIGKAMESGTLAAEQIHVALSKDSSWPLWQLTAKIERELAPKYQGYLVAQRWLSIPWLTDLLAAQIRLDRSLREDVAGVVNEGADPRAVFSWRAFAGGWRRSGSRSSGIKNREQQ